MRYEHWKLDNGQSCIFPETHPQLYRDLLLGVDLAKESKFCCSIYGVTWEEIMTKYYLHMDWGKYPKFHY